MLDLFSEFQMFVSKLSKQRIDYALCGGLAMAVYGIVRATVDMDFLILVESLDDVKAIAREMGYTFEAQPMRFASGAIEIRRISKIDPDSNDLLMLDLLLVTPLIQDVWESRTELEWERESLSVVSREGLIKLKSFRGSGQDNDDIKRLRGTES